MSPILTHPTCIRRPRRKWFRSNFADIFGVRKLQSRAIVWCCLCDPAFSRFSRTPTCDRQTQMDTGLWLVPRMHSKQEARLSPSDRAMRLVSSNLANCHATVQKLLIRQVPTKLMVWSWRFSRRQLMCHEQCALNHDATESAPIVSSVINKPTTVELCISPVYQRLAVAKFSKSTM